VNCAIVFGGFIVRIRSACDKKNENYCRTDDNMLLNCNNMFTNALTHAKAEGSENVLLITISASCTVCTNVFFINN
jgi:hypothetical protein